MEIKYLRGLCLLNGHDQGFRPCGAQQVAEQALGCFNASYCGQATACHVGWGLLRNFLSEEWMQAIAYFLYVN